MRKRSQTRGVALIITLAMIAMLTFLIVAYFSRSVANVQIETASTSSTRADVLAKTAAEIIVSDFKAEIVAGSTASGATGQARVYQPDKPLNAIPAVTWTQALKNLTGGGRDVFANLVKQSADRFFPASTDYKNANPTIQSVTDFSTDVVSANGRSVVNYRWDNPAQLTPLGPLLLVSPPPPAAPPNYSRFYSNSMLPHWVLMTRGGVPAAQAGWDADWKNYASTNTKAAIGRFAFNVYDEGGLLDVNAVGYPEVSTPSMPDAALGQKGSLGLAQLSLVPGMGTTPGEAATNATAFTKTWRNLASGTSVNNYLAYLGFPRNGVTDLTGNPFFLAGPKTGFLSAANSTTLADNHVLGRQDLIRLGIKTAGATVGAPPVYGLSFASLPYLTHFTRELNAPSWFPQQNAGDKPFFGNNNPASATLPPYAYKDNKDNPNVANRFLPNVRVAPGSNWRRLTGELAVPGEPLIKYRFPLSWLVVLQDGDPGTPAWDLTLEAKTLINTLDARNRANGGPGFSGFTLNEKADYFVQRAFGLKWNKTPDPKTSQVPNRWDYTGSPSGSATLTGLTDKLEVLGDSTGTGSMVAADGREPNFFELLKAGILSGSLGSSSDFESMCSNIGEDSNPDNQIVQIGANIIDQADPDSYPTLIGFGYEKDRPPDVSAPLSKSNTPQNLASGDVKVFAGVEDLPYMYTFLSTPYRIPAGEKTLRVDTDPTSPTHTQNAQRDVIDSWLQFVLWKPQQPATNTAAPTSFRIAYTGQDVHLTVSGNTGLEGGAAPIEFPVTVPPSGIKYGYRSTEPVLTHLSDLDPPRTVTFNDQAGDFRIPTLLGGMGPNPDHGFSCSQPEGNGGSPRPDGRLPRGMWLGETYRPEYISTASSPNRTAPPTSHTEFRCDTGCRFELQYSDGANGWRTYQRYDNFGLGTGRYVPGSRGTPGRGLFGFADNPPGHRDAGSPLWPPGATKAAWTYLDIATMAMGAIDPRSHRYGLMAMYLNLSATKVPKILPPPGVVAPDQWKYFLKQGWTPSTISQTSYWMTFSPSSTRFKTPWLNGAVQNPWQNKDTGNPIVEPTKVFADNVLGSDLNSYSDPDGVTRRADGDTTNNIRPLQLANSTTPNTQDLGKIINRPFRNVAELAYAFRDEPYKTLNLFTEKSADSALLDLFSVNDQPAVIAGKVNLNTQNPSILQAVIVGATREESTTNTISAADALTMANNLIKGNTQPSGVNAGTNTLPLVNPAEIVNRLATMLPMPTTGGSTDQTLKSRREVVARALAGSGQTRTWNFLIDVIAQSGRYGPNATVSSQFIVEGEKRYWLHVAIDRYTGQVIDQQLESVME